MDTQPETNPLSQAIVGHELNNRREAIAATQHEIWAHWMDFLFKCCESDCDGRAVIPADMVKRWKRQIGTEYECLKEWEKESDREQADKVLDRLKVLDTMELRSSEDHSLGAWDALKRT